MSRQRPVAARRASIPLELLHRVLDRHRGAANAIKLKDLVVVLGLRGFSDPGRAIRDAINELIDVHGVPIGSITAEGPRGGNSGYFVVVDKEELRECVGQLRRRIEKTERHIDRLIAAYRHGPQQPKLFGTDAPDETPTTAAATAATGPIPEPGNAPADHPRAAPTFVPNFREVIDRLSGNSERLRRGQRA